MDVIGEEEGFGDFQDTTTDSSPSINGENGEQQQIEGNSISESDSEECSEYETDFAKRLKMQQKQVLNKDGTKKKKKTEDFSKQLQKHRDDLVNTWEEDHQHHQQQNISSGSSPDDSEFGTFEDAKQFPAATDNDKVESFDTAEMEQFFDAEVSGNGTNGNREPENTNKTGSDVNLSLDIPDVSEDDLLSALDKELKNIEAEEEENDGGVDLAAEDYENLMNGCLTSPGKITKIEDGGRNGADYGDLVQSGTDELMAYVDKIGESSTSNKEDSTEPLAALSQDSNPRAEDDEPATSETQPPPSDRNGNADNAAEAQEGETINTIEDDGFGDYGSTSEPTGGASELTDSVSPNDDGGMVMPTISSVNTSDDAADGPFNGMDIQDAPMKPLDQSDASDVGGTSSLLDGAAAGSALGAGDENLFAPTADAGISNNNTQEIDKSEVSEADAVPADDKGDIGEFDTAPATEAQTTTDAVNNNDFGDFDTAPPSDSPDSADVNHDFGEFDTAPATEAETTTDAVNNNDFGDFDTAPPSDSPDPADVNHDFGEFDTAPATETATEAKADAGNDNDFGDFDAAPPSLDSPDPADDNHDFGGFDNAPETETTTDAVNDDEFGGFDAAPSSDAPDPTSAAAADDRGDFNNGPASKSSEKAPDDHNDFGDFGAAPPLADPLATTDNDDFGDFDNALAAETTTDAVNGNAVNDNDFGDFGAASPSENPPASTDNDGFGDFDNAAAAETTTDALNDDDFGDFDAAPSSAAPPASPENDAFGGFDNAPAAETTTDAVNDDGFGDFDAAPPSADPPESTDNDDFGDFGNAPVAMKTTETTDAISDNDFGNFDAAPTRSAPESTDDDDWGDFDDAPAATPVAEESEDNKNDNDFGNFDAAPPAAAPAANTDDDDWGDFDDAPAAPAATPTAAAPPVSARPTSADDNDDFGDFDNAPEATVAATPQFEPPTTAGNEEFGDFGTPQSEPSTKHERAPPIDGPELQKARAVFAPMQSKYGFDDVNDDAMEQNLTEELAKANIQSFLAEQEKNKNELPARVKNESSASSSSYMFLKKMLSSRLKPETQPATTTAASKFIVKNDGRGSYYYFAYPIGGLRPPRREDAGKMGEIRRDQNSTSSPSSPSSKKVPVVLSIELPTGNQVPLSVSSPKKSTPKKIKSTQESLKRNDAPLIPTLHGGGYMQNGGRPVNAATTATFQSNKSSDAAEQLARKIPDLNFMLQSKLVLPQKK